MKIVRDKIPEKIIEKEDSCNYAECKDELFYNKLLEHKLIEEANEFITAPYDISEAADVVTVLYYMYHNWAKADYLDLEEFFKLLQKATFEKLAENGGFDKKYILFNEKDLKEE